MSTQNKLSEMNALDVGQLKKNLNKDELCIYIQNLRSRVDELESYALVAKRVQNLERSHLNSLQYQRRESVEICGLPETVSDDNLESTCIDILNDIGCGKMKKNQVRACHRLKNRGKAIIRFVNRKNADLALHNKKHLKDLDKQKYGLTNNVYINESLCRPMGFLAFKVRSAFKKNKVQSFNL